MDRPYNPYNRFGPPGRMSDPVFCPLFLYSDSTVFPKKTKKKDKGFSRIIHVFERFREKTGKDEWRLMRYNRGNRRFFLGGVTMLLLFSALAAARMTASAQTASAAGRSGSGRPAAKTFKDDKEFIDQLCAACGEAQENYIETDNASAEKKARAKLRTDVKNLRYLLNRNSNRKDADGWMRFLKLNELQRSLDGDQVDMETLKKSLERFSQDQDGLEELFFQKVKKSISDYVLLLTEPENLEERKKTFAEACRQIEEAAAVLLSKDDADASESITASLRLMKEYQPESADVRTAAKLIRQRFGHPNVLLEVGKRCLFQDKAVSFKEDISVNEIIRGTNTVGNGTVNGTTSLAFEPNANRAEIQIAVHSQIVTRTTGYNQGVQVQSANTGVVNAFKSIYFTDQIQTEATKTVSSMDTRLLSINSGRGPIGSSVVQDRVYQELPYSKAESQRRMELRLADRVDDEVNKMASRSNGFNRVMKFLRENDYALRNLSSSTTDSRLYWSALLGNDFQPGPGNVPKEDGGSYDLLLRIHQSAPNNAAFFALEGNRVSDQEFIKKVTEILPGTAGSLAKNGARKDDSKSGAAADEKAGESGSEETQDSSLQKDKPFYMTFAEELPLMTLFADDKIAVTARIDLFEQEEKEFPGLDIEIVYAIEKEGSMFVLRKVSLDAWPAGADRNASIPARFQAIRTQLLKRIGDGLKAVYALKPIVLPDSFGPNASSSTSKERGVLNLSRLSAKDGWLFLGAEVLPITKKK